MAAPRTRTVQNTLQLPGTGQPYANREIKIRLNVPSFTNGGAVEKVRTATVTTDNTGAWSHELEVNDDLDPAGTYYTVVEASKVIWTFVVQASDPDPVSLRACLQVAPGNPTPLVAVDVAAVIDAVFANAL